MKDAVEESIMNLIQINYMKDTKNQKLSNFYWLKDYARDIFITMKESELQRRKLGFRTKQLNHRPHLLSLTQRICDECELPRSALHLSIYYMDRILDSYTVREDKLELIVISCLRLAAQIECKEMSIPRYAEMNEIAQQYYTPFEFRAVERKLLTFFDFKLLRPTTMNYIEMFSASFFTLDDYKEYNDTLREETGRHLIYTQYTSHEEMTAHLIILLLQIADQTLYIHRLGNELPSLLAASCIAAVRHISSLSQRWTPHLEELTSYKDEQLSATMDIIIINYYYHNNDNPEIQNTTTVDSSYATDSGFDENSNTPLEIDNNNGIPYRMMLNPQNTVCESFDPLGDQSNANEGPSLSNSSSPEPRVCRKRKIIDIAAAEDLENNAPDEDYSVPITKCSKYN